MVAAETYISRPPPSGRSKRRITAIDSPSLSTNRPWAASIPAAAANRRANISPLVTDRSSATLGNLPIDSRPSASITVHFGRNPPRDVPRPLRNRRSAAVSLLVSTALDADSSMPSSISGGAVRRPSSAARWKTPFSSLKRKAPTRLASSTASRKSSALRAPPSPPSPDRRASCRRLAWSRRITRRAQPSGSVSAIAPWNTDPWRPLR